MSESPPPGQTEEFRQIVEQMPFAASVVDPDGTCVMVNRAFLELFGVPSASLVEGRYNCFRDPVLGRLGLAPDVRRVFAGETLHLREVELPLDEARPGFELGRRGRVFIDVTLFPVFAGDRLRHVVTVWKDTTEACRGARLLALQRDLAVGLGAATDLAGGLQLCLDAALRASEMDCGGIYLRDPATGAFELVAHGGLSPRFVEAVGHEPASSPRIGAVLSGTPVYSSPGAHSELLEALREMEGLQAIGVVPIVRDGEVLGCLNVASRTEREITDAMRAALETIGAQTAGAIAALRTKAALADSERRYRLLADNQADVVFTLGLDRRATYVSPSIAALLGYSVEEAMRLTAAQVVIADSDTTDRWRLVDPAAPPGVVQTREIVVRHRDGRPIPVELRAKVLRGEDGAPIGFLGGVRDIRERKEAEAEREKLRAQLYQMDKMNAVGMLAAGVAHEINNPLAFLLPSVRLLRAQLLGERRRPRAEVEQILADCEEGLERIARITQELRQFARPDDRPEPVGLPALLDSALAIAGSTLRFRAHVVRAYAETPPVLGARGKLGQVFLNILLNALQAIPEGRAEEHWIRVRTRREGDWACAEVANNGAPIPAEVLPRIFDPFFTTKGHGLGTGLGLSVSLSIVQQHGGRIEAESPPGGPTTLRVWLPGAAGATVPAGPGPGSAPGPAPSPGVLAAPGSAPSPEALAARPARVLFVDDEAALQRAAPGLLWPHTAVTVGDGEAALALLSRDARFDVILCDVALPGLSGIDVYERLVASAPALARRLVFMTGGAFRPHWKEFLDRVASPKLEKPLDPDVLQATILRVVAGTR